MTNKYLEKAAGILSAAKTFGRNVSGATVHNLKGQITGAEKAGTAIGESLDSGRKVHNQMFDQYVRGKALGDKALMENHHLEGTRLKGHSDALGDAYGTAKRLKTEDLPKAIKARNKARVMTGAGAAAVAGGAYAAKKKK